MRINPPDGGQGDNIFDSLFYAVIVLTREQAHSAVPSL